MRFCTVDLIIDTYVKIILDNIWDYEKKTITSFIHVSYIVIKEKYNY